MFDFTSLLRQERAEVQTPLWETRPVSERITRIETLVEALSALHSVIPDDESGKDIKLKCIEAIQELFQ